MRIFIGLIEVCGYYTNLKKGFDELGVETTFANLSAFDSYRKYGGGDTDRLIHSIRILEGRIAKISPRNAVAQLWWRLLRYLSKTLLFFWAFIRHDVFIFSFGSTFFSYLELPLLRLFGKKIIYVFHGSDSRPPYIGAGAQKRLDAGPLKEETDRVKKRVEIIDRYADAIIDSPLSAHFHTRPVISFQVIGLPFVADIDAPHDTTVSGGSGVRIVHSPSNPEFKGTPRIREAIANLKRKGHPIDYVEMIGRSNAEVLRELARCDFVVDQLNGEGPISGFGTEAAYFGKAAINGTHTNDSWEIHSEDQIPLVHHCRNEEIESAIEKLIVDRDYRVRLGENAKHFVRSNWTPARVAGRYIRIIDDDVPADWFFDPQTLRYVHGWGPEHLTRQAVRKMIAHGGIEALCLDDKPELIKRFIEFAGLETQTSADGAISSAADPNAA